MIFGHKGGGKGGGGESRSPVEDPNTLLSRSTVRIVDVIGEGPIVGLVNGFQSIYLDGTPVQNADGSFNYKGVSYEQRTGLPNQDYLTGFPAAENEIALGIQVKQALSVSSQISDNDANAVLVKIKVNALTVVDTKTGDMHGTSVTLAFDIKTVSGSFVEVGQMTISGKTTSAYERSKRLELPPGGAPWTIRVRRLTPDSTSTYLSNDTYVSTYTVLTDAKLSYPDTALIGYKVDAQEFGSNSPTRITKQRGIISDVPSNWNPTTRVYTGLWDGTFKKAWHNHPVWALWLLMTNKRFGLGDVIKPNMIDKYGLYSIAQYCDELVPNGYGGFEPRYTFNGVINSKQNAAAVLDSIASVFRGMIYWGSGSAMFTADKPGTPVKLVTPANVINGEFNYSGSSLSSRHTSVLVTWNDPEDLGRSAIESVQRDDLIQQFGFRETTANAYGCTSRGQARRVGEWLLDTEANETEVVIYQASLDHADVRPGNLISVADPEYAGGRYGGRLLASSTQDILVIDKGVPLVDGSIYQIATVLPDGSVETRQITSAPGEDVTVISLAVPLSQMPVDGALWVISGTEVSPRLFRVVSNVEKSDNVYEITALFHDPTKYARVERDINLAPPNYAIQQTGPLAPPTGLTLREFFKAVGSSAQPAATMAWNIIADPRVSAFELQIKGPNDPAYRQSIVTAAMSYDDFPTSQGVYSMRVRSTALFVQPSPWAEFETYVLGPGQPPADVLGFSIATTGPSSVLTWNKAIDVQAIIIDHYEIRFNRDLIGATWENSDILVASVPKGSTTVTVPARAGTYLIKAVSFASIPSVNAGVITSEIAGVISQNVVAEFVENPDWLGVKDRTTAVDDELFLSGDQDFNMSDWGLLSTLETMSGNFEPIGYYYFDNSIDLGAIGKARIDYVVKYNTLDLVNTMATWVPLASAVPLSVLSDKASVTTQIRTSQDGTTFNAWSDAILGDYVFRKAEFRLVLETEAPTITPRVTAAEVIIDMEDRVANGVNVVCPSGGLRIDFTPNFMAEPSVHIDGQGLVTGDYHRVTLRDETGFTVQFFNSAGTGKSVTFDWIAKGYGYKQ